MWFFPHLFYTHCDKKLWTFASLHSVSLCPPLTALIIGPAYQLLNQSQPLFSTVGSGHLYHAFFPVLLSQGYLIVLCDWRPLSLFPVFSIRVRWPSLISYSRYDFSFVVYSFFHSEESLETNVVFRSASIIFAFEPTLMV